MKKLLLSGAAALVLAACGGQTSSPADVDAALVQLSLKDSGSGRVEFEDRSVSGADATFKNVKIRTSDFAEDDETSVDTAVSGDGVDVEINADSADLLISEMIMAGLKLDDAGKANFSKMTLNTIKALPTEEPDEEVNVSAQKFELVGPTPELAAWLGGVFGTAEKADLPDADNIKFQSLKLTNFLAEGTEEGDDANFAIASISVDDVNDAKIGDMAMKGMDLAFTDSESGQSGVFKLGNISLKGAKTDYLKAAMADGEEESANALMDAMYENPVDPGFDNFSMSDLLFDMAGLKVTLPSFAYDIDRDGSGQPKKFTIPKFNLSVDFDADGGELGAQVAPMLMAVGFEDLVISGEGVSTYDAKTDIATTEKSIFSVKDAFVLDVTSKIGGMKEVGAVMQDLDSEAFASGETDPNAMMMDMYSKMDFHEMTISLKDEGVINKGLSFFAAQQGMEPEQLRQMAAGMAAGLPMMAAQFGVDPAIATELASASSKFLTDGGTLTLAFEPAEPFTLTAFMEDPSALTKDRLGFSASVK